MMICKGRVDINTVVGSKNLISRSLQLDSIVVEFAFTELTCEKIIVFIAF